MVSMIAVSLCQLGSELVDLVRCRAMMASTPFTSTPQTPDSAWARSPSCRPAAAWGPAPTLLSSMIDSFLEPR